MQVVDRSVLLPPGVCFLCECTPAEGEKIVDTARNFTPGFPSKLAGVKYLCKPCIEGVGELVGLVSSEVRDAAVANQARAEARLNAVRDHVAAFVKSLDDSVLDDVQDRAPLLAAEASAAAEEPAEEPKPKKAKA